jgi:hypothetical protein
MLLIVEETILAYSFWQVGLYSCNTAPHSLSTDGFSHFVFWYTKSKSSTSLPKWHPLVCSACYNVHSLLHVCCSPASAKGRSGTPSRLQAASHDPRRTSKGHQMGDTEGDHGPVQAGQRLPLPAWAFFPLANHYTRLRSGYSRKQGTEQTTGGHEEGRGRGFYSPEGFPFPVTR